MVVAIAYDASRIADHNGPGWNGSRHHRTRAHDCPPSNGDPTQDDGTGSNPDGILHDNIPFCAQWLALHSDIGCHPMVIGKETTVRGNHDVIANMNGREIGGELTPTSDGREVANRDSPAFPGIELASSAEPHAISHDDRSSILIANQTTVVAQEDMVAQAQIIMLHQDGRRDISEFSQLGNALLFVVGEIRQGGPRRDARWPVFPGGSNWHTASTLGPTAPPTGRLPLLSTWPFLH